jgi:hypothetical protein
MDRFAGREQPWPGSSLALLGRKWLAAGWFDLRCPALRDTSVATPSANVVGRLPGGVAAIVAYFDFRLPPEGNPFNAIQQLTYCFIIFILSPLQIVTGIMMSPALGARFPGFPEY